MSLFTLPKREETDIASLIKKANEPPRVKKNINLAQHLVEIEEKVQRTLGKEAKGFLCLNTDKEFLAYCEQAKKDGIVAIDTETTGLDSMLDKLVGICLYSPSQRPAYFPVGHLSYITETKMNNQVTRVKEGMELLKLCKCIFHNAYFDLVIIYNNCGIMLPVYWDTQIAANLLNENESHTLKDLYAKYILNGEVPATYYKDLFAGVPFCYIPPIVGTPYAAKDPLMTYELFRFQEEYLDASKEDCKAYGLEKTAKLYKEVELPIIPVIVDMKIRGIDIDYNRADELIEKYTLLKEDAEREFYSVLDTHKKKIDKFRKDNPDTKLGNPINYNSPLQLSILFYQVFNLGVIDKKYPTGTGDAVLQTILHNDKYKEVQNLVRVLVKVKEYDKAINSFIIKIKKVAQKYGGKIHPSFNSQGTVTGRFSSSDSATKINVQQIPAKQKDIRTMFIAGEGKVLIGADYSKQEVLAAGALSGENLLLDSFRQGLDIYSHVASLAYGVPYEECLEHRPDGSTNEEGKKRRSNCKAIVLGLMYGKQIKSISEDLNVSIEKAREIRDSVLGAFPKLASWMEYNIETAHKTGMLENPYGRRRRLPEIQLPKYTIKYQGEKPIDETTKTYYTGLIKSKLKLVKGKRDFEVLQQAIKNKYNFLVIDNSSTIAKCERECTNSLVQSSSAVVTKIAMIKIFQDKELAKLDCHLVLTIHDEIQLTCPKENVIQALPIIQKHMEDAGKDLTDLFKTDVAISDRWYGKEYKIENGKLIEGD